MPEYVSTAEAQSGVVGRTSLPPTILQPGQQQQPQAPQFAPQPSVDTGSLINQAIDARRNIEAQRQGLSAQRAQIIQQMSSVPPGRRGARQEAALNAQLRGLDFQERDLTSQQHFQDFATREQMSATFRNAQMAHKLSQEQLTHQTAQEAGEVFLKGTEIMGKYKPGTQEFQDAMSQLRDQYPLGFASEAVKGHFGQIAKFHDQEKQRIQNSLTNTLLKNNLTPEQFSSATNVRGTNAPMGSTLDAIEKGRADTGARGEKAQNIAFDVDGQTLVMDKLLFNTLSKTFRQPQQQQISVAPAVSAEDAYAQSQGYRNAAQLERYRAGGPLTASAGQPPSAPAQPAAADNTRPTVQIGERRTIGGIPAEWDGRGWKKVTQ